MNVQVKDIYGEFYRNVLNKPNEVMIYTEEKNITYSEAMALVSSYAEAIVTNVGKENRRIILYLDHSYRIIISILAILKTGKSYVPVKPGDKNRLKSISKYCETNIVMTDQVVDESYAVIDVLQCEKNRNTKVSESSHFYNQDEEVYVLFTSGSTGTPKGCSITYSNLCYIINNMRNFMDNQVQNVYCFSTPYTFDVSVTEIYSFCYGASLLVYDTTVYQKYAKMPEIFEKYKVTHFAVSPSSLKNIIKFFKKDKLQQLTYNLKCVMVAGEAFKEEIFKKWDKENWKFNLWNLYGPTEATVYATGYKLHHGEDIIEGIPIGQCLQGVEYFIDNPDDKGIGELVIGGEGIAAGYINNISEQKKRFLKSRGQRYYRTGDLVSEKNGLLYYHGRNDDQVQINGIRVELGEIESLIRSIPDVNEAVVMYINNKLIAYLCVEGNRDGIELMIRKSLPRYMQPHRINYISSIPLNSNGKIDRKKLIQDVVDGKQKNENMNANEYEISEMMRECLGLSESEYNSNLDFFENGADSLTTFILLGKLENKYGLKISVDLIYTFRTARRIADYLSSLVEHHEEDILQNQGNITDLLKKITELSQAIEQYLYVDDELCIEKYKTLNTQKFYFNEKFNSVVSFEYEFPEGTKKEAVSTILKKCINSNSILRSKLILENDELFFKEYIQGDEVRFPQISIDVSINDLVDFIKKSFARDVFRARYQNGYLALFVLVECRQKYYVVGILDHTIADASCIAIIKKYIGQLYIDGKASEHYKYADYCKAVCSHNTDVGAALNNWYVDRLRKAYLGNREEVIEQLTDGQTHLSQMIDEDSSINISIRLAFIVAKTIAEKIKNKYIAIRTLFNIREYDGYSYKDTIGDVHVGMSFIYETGMNLAEFRDCAYRTIELFSKAFYRPDYVIEENELGFENERKQLKKVIRNSSIACVNYLGKYNDVEFEEFRTTIAATQKSLYAASTDIYATAVSNGSKLHIYISKDFNKNGK